MTGTTEHADVAVVGAGLSGLVAARRLAGRGLRVAVLEARDRVGGRTLNADVGAGKTVEIGGQFVGPGHDALLRVAAEVGVATFPTHNTGRNLLELGGRMRSWNGVTPWAGPVASASFLRAQRALNHMAREVRPEAPWLARRAREWDGETLAGWMRRRMASRRARSLLATAIRAIWAVEPEDVSLLHALTLISATGKGLEYQIRTRGGYQQDRFVGGSQRISQLLAAELPDPPMLGHPVRRIAPSWPFRRCSPRGSTTRRRCRPDGSNCSRATRRRAR